MVKNAEALLGSTSGESAADGGAGPRRPDANASPSAEGAALQTMFEYDAENDQLRWSDEETASRLLGVTDAKQISKIAALNQRLVGEADEVREAVFAGDALNYCCEYQIKRDHGDPVWLEERGGWVGAGPSRRLISVIRSVDNQKQKEARLAWLANNDELTGLLNRVQLRRQLEGAIMAAQKESRSAAYLLAGIDELGAVNADFGFDTADKVIVEVSKRLASVLGPKDFIGRVAGTKFGIVLHDCDEAGLRQMSVRLLNAVRETVIETRGSGIAASICLGSVIMPAQAVHSNMAMAHAEAALDAAKRLGKSSWAPFSEQTDAVSTRRRNTQMSDVILTALNERRIRLAFQPIVSDLGEPHRKFECLIRMNDEEGREIPAPEFIPTAERLGLVHLLDRRVLELALNTLAVCPDILLNVNISMETVKDFVWAEGYLSLLRANQARARRITVELTETQVIDAIEASIEFVSEIKKLGCSFAIDDFGAGYTSFRNLKAMDIDILKIDGSFVTGVSASRENQLFVRTLLDLARNFGMQTVAEWVDNEADAMLLKGLGVDYLQGYLIGKPEINPEWLPEGAPNEPPSSLERL